MAVGAAVGAALGTGSAAYIISRHYDVGFNRGLTCLFVIGGATASGVLGGYAGAAWSAPSAPSNMPAPAVTTFEPMNLGSYKIIRGQYTWGKTLPYLTKHTVIEEVDLVMPRVIQGLKYLSTTLV